MEFSFTKSFELKEIPEINQISYYAKKDKPENLEEIKS